MRLLHAYQQLKNKCGIMVCIIFLCSGLKFQAPHISFLFFSLNVLCSNGHQSVFFECTKHIKCLCFIVWVRKLLMEMNWWLTMVCKEGLQWMNIGNFIFGSDYFFVKQLPGTFFFFFFVALVPTFYALLRLIYIQFNSKLQIKESKWLRYSFHTKF